MSSFFDLYQNQEKQKKELPQWYQDSAVGQFARQSQDRANQWFGHVVGDQAQQYADTLKKQGQDWFLQTPVGQGVNDFYSGFFSPAKRDFDDRQQRYKSQLSSMYADYQQAGNKMANDAMKKMGVK